MKNTDFTCGEISIPSCPTRMPASKVPVTLPSVKLPNFTAPTQYPRPIARKIASSGFWRSVSKMNAIMTRSLPWVVHSPGGGRLRGGPGEAA